MMMGLPGFFYKIKKFLDKVLGSERIKLESSIFLIGGEKNVGSFVKRVKGGEKENW